MWRNYFLIAFRSFFRNKKATLLTSLGLVLGLSCTLLIGMFVIPEFSGDQEYSAADRIYKINYHEFRDGEDDRVYGLVFGSLAPRMHEETALIENYLRLFNLSKEVLLVTEGGKSVKSNEAIFVDSSFFSFFEPHVISGHSSTALVEPSSIVLTESLAKNLFGDEDAIGKTVLGHESVSYLVTAVVSDPPQNSQLQYDALVSWSTTVPNIGPLNWSSINGTRGNIHTYLMASEGVSAADLEAGMVPYKLEVEPDTENLLEAQPMRETYLHSQSIEFLVSDSYGDSQTVWVLVVLGLFVLANGIINYVNIQTAKSQERLREMGLRKVMGATRWKVIVQGLIETLTLTLMVGLMAYLLTFSIAPAFSSWVGLPLSQEVLRSSSLLWGFLALPGLVVVLAGVYPALVLSRFQPTQAFAKHKKWSGAGQGSTLRRGLTTLQFATSLLVLMGTLVIYQQVRFQRDKDLGAEIDQLVHLPVTPDLSKNKENFREALVQMPEVAGVSISLDVLGEGGTSSVTTVTELGDRQFDIDGRFFGMDAYFMETYGLEVIVGKAINPQLVSDKGKVLVNETLARRMGWRPEGGEAVVGERVHLYHDEQGLEIVGIVRDFHFQSMRYQVEPMVLQNIGDKWAGTISVRFDADDTPAFLASLEKVWLQYEPNYPFEYAFVTDKYAAMYRQDEYLLRGMIFFSIVSVLMAALGLFGLVSFEVALRRKEIGIRKVLGATVQSLLWSINYKLVALFGLALLVALPTGYFLLAQWLSGFAYHSSLSIGTFGLAVLGATLLFSITAGSQTFWAAMENPVDSIRDE